MNCLITKVSIIVPVYNTGDLLKRCVKSIINQSLNDIEVILINDGSDYYTTNICNEISKTDKRIRVIHKKNEGVSVARNLGIKIAKGKYIGFVDSDDYINNDMYKIMYDIAIDKNCEVVMVDCKIHKDNTICEDTIVELNKSTLLSKTNFTPSLLKNMAGSMWRCLYMREFLIEKNIVCPLGLKLSEDRVFNILAFGQAQNIYYLKNALYNQIVRGGSATQKYHQDIIEVYVKYKENIFLALEKAWNSEEEYVKCYNEQMFNFAFQCIKNEFFNKENKNFYKRYKAIKHIGESQRLKKIIVYSDKNSLKQFLVKNKCYLLITVMLTIKNKKMNVLRGNI